MCKKFSSIIGALLISAFIAKGKTSHEFFLGQNHSWQTEISENNNNRYSFLKKLNKSKTMTSPNEYKQTINEIEEAKESEALRNKMIKKLKLGTIKLITVSSIVTWLNYTWFVLYKKEIPYAVTLVLASAVVQLFFGAVSFGMIKMLQSNIGPAFARIWYKEEKQLFGLTMLGLILSSLKNFKEKGTFSPFIELD